MNDNYSRKVTRFILEAVLQEDEQIYESLDEFKRRENGDDYLLKYAGLW